MVPGYTSFIGKMRGTYSCKGLVLYRKHFIKHNTVKNIMGEEQVHRTAVGRNFML